MVGRAGVMCRGDEVGVCVGESLVWRQWRGEWAVWCVYGGGGGDGV